MKILIADKFEESGMESLRAMGCEVVFAPELTPETIGERIRAEDPGILVVRSTKVPRGAIESGPSLRGVIRAGAGYDNIDTGAATERGIAVCNCPGMNAVAVAELVFGLLLCCDRRIPDQTRDVRAGKWNKKEYAKARGLKGMTLGVIGVGGIGRQVIKRAKAFDMNVVANSIGMTPQRAEDLGVGYGGYTREDMYEMLGKCDAVSIHVAANPQSAHLCDKRFFDAMKAGAYFINTSRGSVMDGPALEEAVRSKGIRIGLDVFTNEPSTPVAEWQCTGAEYPAVYFTHHVGASTDQAQLAVAEEVVRIVSVFKETGSFENRVNPSVSQEQHA